MSVVTNCFGRHLTTDIQQVNLIKAITFNLCWIDLHHHNNFFDASFTKILEFIKTNKTVDLNQLIGKRLDQKQMLIVLNTFTRWLKTIHFSTTYETSTESNIRQTTRQIFDEDKLISNSVFLVFCEEHLERNGRQVTVFSNASVEELRCQQRRNIMLFMIQLIWLWCNGLIHSGSFQ